MTGEDTTAARAAGPPTALELVTLHALAWLVTGTAVGLLLALLLLAPGLGTLLGPLGYGRWMPLHMNLLLYGWCALPLLGMLLRLYLGPTGGSGGAVLGVHLWSAALAAGAASWLTGSTTGKLFLDWRGAPRWLFLAALAWLAAVLLAALLRAAAADRRAPGPVEPPLGLALRALLWLALAAVPPAMWLATEPCTYPPINPASGGPTGASLLGSTVGLLWIFAATPWGLALARPRQRRATGWFVGAAALHTALFLALGHADASHHETLQIVALASLAPWAWAVPAYLAPFDWPAAARRWLGAFLAWAAALLATGLVAFLPGVLERTKFTNGLVAHAHVAMAGMASAFAALLLATLGRDGRLAAVFARRDRFWSWHGGTLLQVGALLAVGTLEAIDPGVLFRPSAAVDVLYALRAVGGAAMLAAALGWLRDAWRELGRELS